MTKKGHLFVVSGPTAAGKGTICNKLCERRPDIKLSVSCATRAPRPIEVEGVHYFFITNERFNEMIERGELLEHANVHGNQYGTPRAFVMNMLEQGFDVILEIDVQGAKQVRTQELDLTPIFVLPPSRDELLRRLMSRGTESPEQVATRLHTVASELKEADSYPYLIVNDDLDAAVDRLEAIIDASHSPQIDVSDSQKEAHEELLHSLYEQFQEVHPS